MCAYRIGRNIENQRVVANFLKGNMVIGKNKIAITQQVNKYNRALLSDVKEVDLSFYKLIRANKIAIELIKEKGITTTSEQMNSFCKNLEDLIGAQCSTIEYNKRMRNALTKYGIVDTKIYDALANEIRMQQDRVRRNTNTLYETIQESRIGRVLINIENKTSMNFIEYIDYLEESREEERHSTLITTDDLWNEYYSELDKYQLSKVLEFI